MLLEMHIIQNFAPSNLNRDEYGMPKDCEFAGFRRARISSQCIKRSIRKHESFKDNCKLSKRTKRTYSLLFNEFIQIMPNEQSLVEQISDTIISKYIDSKYDSKKKLNSVLIFTDTNELSVLADSYHKMLTPEIQELLLKSKLNKDDTKVITKFYEDGFDNFKASQKKSIESIDIALFGRMLAKTPEMKIEAACQVAHAISTNKVSMDFDYFTAVDDLNPDEETGAGMIGNIGFNSSCFYRYASLDLNRLMSNISNKKELAVPGILGFIEGAIEAIPTGKQNTFAANNPPAYVLITASEKGMPVSLANAFEKPVMPDQKLALSEKSTQALLIQFDKIKKLYDLDFDKEFEFGDRVDAKGNILSVGSKNSIINDLEDYLNQKL